MAERKFKVGDRIRGLTGFIKDWGDADPAHEGKIFTVEALAESVGELHFVELTNGAGTYFEGRFEMVHPAPSAQPQRTFQVGDLVRGVPTADMHADFSVPQDTFAGKLFLVIETTYRAGYISVYGGLTVRYPGCSSNRFELVRAVDAPFQVGDYVTGKIDQAGSWGGSPVFVNEPKLIRRIDVPFGGAVRSLYLEEPNHPSDGWYESRFRLLRTVEEVAASVDFGARRTALYLASQPTPRANAPAPVLRADTSPQTFNTVAERPGWGTPSAGVLRDGGVLPRDRVVQIPAAPSGVTRVQNTVALFLSPEKAPASPARYGLGPRRVK